MLVSTSGFSQRSNLGTPLIHNYSKDEYKGGTHNWNIISANNRLYFANDNGLLEYNGHAWALYRLPKKTIVRSLASDARGRIFVGGQDEIGYFFPDQFGALQYQDMKDLIPAKYRSFEDVWDLVEQNGIVFARSIDRILTFNKNEVNVIDPLQTISFLCNANGRIYFNQINEGIYEYYEGDIRFVNRSDIFRGVVIIDIVEFGGKLLVLTQNEGIYEQLVDGRFIPWSAQINPFVEKMRIFSVAIVNESQLAIGTEFGGIIITDNTGRANYILNNDTGLQNNKIASLYSDKNANLWVGSFNGIDQVFINESIRYIYPDDDLKGAVYDVAIHDEKIYFGTNNGLYYCDWKQYYDPLITEGFQIVRNSEGQVWGLDTLGGELLMGHNRGAFIVKNGGATQISPNPGYWKFLEMGGGRFMVAGSYEGISLFKRTSLGWAFVKKMEGFVESSRIIEKENDNRVWVSHPYRGVFRIDFDSEFESIQIRKYTEKDGLPSLLRNHVFKIAGKPIFTGENRILNYNSKIDRFETDLSFTKLFPPGVNVIRLFEDHQNNIWYKTEDDFGYFNISDDVLSKKISKTSYSEFSDQFVAGFENIHITKRNIIYILTDKGAIDYYNYSADKSYALSANISKIHLIVEQDSLLFGGYYNDADSLMTKQPSTQIPVLSHNQNAIRFEYFCNSMIENTNIEFNPYLEYIDVTSNNWSAVNHKEYNNLPPGDYTFTVNSRDNSGHESRHASYSFSILPPWYKTKLAFSIYTILGIIFISGLILIPSSKYKKEAKVLAFAQEKSQEEIIKLKNEKLETTINFKNQQLASSTMHIVQKNEVLNKVKSEVELLKKYIKNPTAEKELRKLESLLSDDERLDDDWESFAYHFDQVHTDFLRRIKEEFPKLSPKDQKLCAYLRMNLSTKEIAPLLNISIRGVEISRYRLRKKVDLDSSKNLNEFMMNY